MRTHVLGTVPEPLLLLIGLTPVEDHRIQRQLLVPPVTPDTDCVKVPALCVAEPANMPVPMSVDTHGSGSPVTVISRVASAVAELVSVARMTNELTLGKPDGGVPEAAAGSCSQKAW
jgi:hypothetical protein